MTKIGQFIKTYYYTNFKYARRKRMTRSASGNALIAILLILMGFFSAIPLIYAVVNAFKPINELFLFPPRFFVKNPTVDNFLEIGDLASGLWVPLSRYIFNSVFISGIGTALYVVIASLCAYPLAKHKWRGRNLLMTVIVWAILFRPEVTGISQYIIISKFNMINTYWAILLPALSGSFGVFLLKQFMETLPNAIFESAQIDGAGEFRIFWSIVMPSVKPAWITLIIFTFNGLWNSNGIAYIYNEEMKMLPAILNQISTGSIARAGVGSAVAVLLMIPPIVLFIFTQSKVMETMSHSGIK